RAFSPELGIVAQTSCLGIPFGSLLRFMEVARIIINAFYVIICAGPAVTDQLPCVAKRTGLVYAIGQLEVIVGGMRRIRLDTLLQLTHDPGEPCFGKDFVAELLGIIVYRRNKRIG